MLLQLFSFEFSISALLGCVAFLLATVAAFGDQILLVGGLVMTFLKARLATLRRFVSALVRFLVDHLFVTHLVGQGLVSIVLLVICLGLKSYILALDPAAHPFDETLIQKVPLALACLSILSVMSFVLIRVTTPGVYHYLNFSNTQTGPETDFKAIQKPETRLCIALGFYLCYMLLGVLLFTGNL